MNKHMIKVVAAVTLLAVATASFAQGQGQRGQGQRGQGQGQGQFQGRGMQGGMMQMSPVFLLMRNDVQDDLKLTAEQRTRLGELQRQQQESMRGMGGRGGGGGGDFQQMREEMQRRQQEMERQVNQILTADQQKRLKEISIQLAGARAVLNEDVQKELGLTAEQRQRIQDLMQRQQEANRALMQQARDGGIEREELQTRMRNNENALNTEIGKVLTAEQNEKLKAMGGAPFRATEQPRGGRGGGGR
jgi:hypothetical protein